MMDTSMLIMSETDSTSDSSLSMSKPKRKRQRLDHLSQEEKLMRRKLKNRMAAQSARDRKKVKMQDLEEEVILLEKQRNALLNQNESLKQKNSFLENQNKELKQRLSILETPIKVENNCSNDWSETFESAALISGPQQKEQVSHPVKQTLPPLLLTTPFALWLIKNLMLYSMFFTTIQKNCSIQRKITTMAHNCRQSMLSNAIEFHSPNTHHIWDQLKTWLLWDRTHSSIRHNWPMIRLIWSTLILMIIITTVLWVLFHVIVIQAMNRFLHLRSH